MSKRSLSNPLDSWLGYLLKRTASAAMSELSVRLQAVDLRQVDASVMLLIENNPRIIASRIGRILDIKTANMVPLLRSLEDKGLLEREPIDGKSHGLLLTNAGKDRLTETRAILDSFETELEERVPQQHREHIVPALQALWRATEELGDRR